VNWGRAALAFAALASALAGLHVLLEGASWWIVGAGYAAAVLIVATAARSLMRSKIWPPVIAFVAGVMLLTLGYAPGTAILGVIPTFDTLPMMRAIIDSGVTSIVEQRVPATPELGIVMLLAMMMVFCAWVCDVLLATRHPALIAVPLAIILTIPMVVRPGLSDAFWFLVTGALYLAILRIGRRPDSRRVTLLVGASVLLGSLIAPYALPDIRESPDSLSAGIRTGVNPLITLGDDLRRGDPVLALSYTTTSQNPVYLRLTTLQNFTGEIWGPDISDVSEGGDLGDFPLPPGLGDDIAAEEVSAQVKVSEVRSRWLPVPYPATRIEGVVGTWYWDADGLTVRSTESSARGQEYNAGYLQIDPTLEQLENAPVANAPVNRRAIDLPENVPEIITQTALDVAGTAGSPYDQALAIQAYLRAAPFAYSEDAPVADGFDGSGLDALAVFLQQKVGYCVHYASAMAVMARTLGIPSRIAVGFQPGDRQVIDGRSVFMVSSDDLHAWPELYFEGIGWLRFEPTPGRGAVPNYGAQLVDDPNTPQDESMPNPGATSTAAPGERPDLQDVIPGAAGAADEQSPAFAIALGVLAGVVLLLAVPGAFRMLVRRRRVRRMLRGPDPAAAAWEELRDTARDFGWSAPDSETPRAFAARLQPSLGDDAAALGILRGSVEVSAFGRPDAEGISVAELTAVRRAMARSHDWRTRLRVQLLPPSLLARWRPDAE
jgi:transglutaminase-like putative cysteine protease